MKYVIYDWAGNLMKFGDFETFEDAWSYLFEKFESEQDLGEFYVTEKEYNREHK